MGSLRGVPVRFHWTVLLGGLVLSGFTFAPAFWVAFTLLVLIHELGHAALVRRFGHRNLSIDVTGFGGLCRWSGHATAFERSAIAWGGVLAQGLLLLITALVVLIAGSPTDPHAAEVVHVFTRSNALLIGINLLPFAPLDGGEAWKILRHGRVQGLLAALRDRLSKRRPARKSVRPSKGPAKVIDFEGARRKRQQSDVAHDPDLPKGPAKDVADELIRLSREAARARKKNDEN